MPAEIIFLLITALVVALVGLAALVAAWRERGMPRGPAAIAANDRLHGGDVAELDPTGLAAGRSAYGAAIRILWWISIASVLVGVGLTDAYRSTQPVIYGLGAAAVIVAVVLHDLLPGRWRTPSVVAFEVLVALALVTSLLALTGYGASPFAFAYTLVAVAGALVGPRIALAVAALATVSYLGVLALDPNLTNATGSDLLRYGLSIATIWLLAFVAGVFSLGERRMREHALALSRTDPLTGLMNRSQLQPMLEREVQRTRRSERGFCLLMVDLDGLKVVNDSHGHHRGDEVLQALGSVIGNSIRAVDTAFRFGGDEFLVILPETDFTGAFVVAEKIRAGAEEVGLGSQGRDLSTSVSIGLVSCPEDGSGADELMRAADRAMYQAKSMGKNQISGNPQPRRLLGSATTPPSAVASAPVDAGFDAGGGPAEAYAERAVSPSAPATATLAPPRVDRVPVAASANGAKGGDDEPDPSDVRRHIAAARLHMDPDHQIRRAMDAFLSPSAVEDR